MATATAMATAKATTKGSTMASMYLKYGQATSMVHYDNKWKKR